MTCQIEQHQREIPVAAANTKPPPGIMKIQSESRLFQSLEELRSEQGVGPSAKERFWFVGGGLLLGVVLFALLYLGILFLE